MNRVGDTVEGFMCLIDAEHELGAADDGNRVYPSIEALKAHHTCWAECGIARVEVRFVAVEVPEDLSRYRQAGI